MIKIQYSKRFKKNFCKRIPENSLLEKKYTKRLNLFIQDPSNKILNNHKLVGKLTNYHAFSITGDIRVIYFQESKETVLFLDIGTHNQVYG